MNVRLDIRHLRVALALTCLIAAGVGLFITFDQVDLRDGAPCGSVTEPTGWPGCDAPLANSRENRTAAAVVAAIAGISLLLTVPRRGSSGQARTAEITTARLLLRRVRRDDADAVYDTIDDVVITANGWPPQVPELVRQRIVAGAPPGQLVIVERSSGRIIGEIEHERPNGGGLATIGFWMGPRRGDTDTCARRSLPSPRTSTSRASHTSSR